MKARMTVAGASVALAGPVVLAFFSGGYFDQPRLWAALAAWTLVLLAAATGLGVVPSSTPGRLAAGALLALAGWVGLSRAWAPLSGVAQDDFERVLLYAGALVAAAAYLRGYVRRWVEPAVALGVLVVIGYGLAGRLVPGLVELSASTSAAGRLEQPLTYWNAMGALAAFGFVLAARLAGDHSRPDLLRAGAAAATCPLGLGIYLSFSRGAIAALVLGLALVLVLAPDWRQLRSVAITVSGAVAVAIVSQALPAVRALEGDAGTREAEGLIALAAVLGFGAAAALAQLVFARGERSGRTRTGRLIAARHTALLATGISVLALGGAALGTALERGPNPVNPAFGATPKRLASTESNRYAYWRVALAEFADSPLKGAGSGGFEAAWLREREVTDPARDAHSLYIETAAELGLVGLGLLVLLFAGVAGAARVAYRVAPAAVAGPAAAVAAWALHAGLDWDWEMPAVSLPALALAGALIALAEPRAG